MVKLSELGPPPGAKKKRKRVGCGPGSGHGKTSCRGHKGHKQRSGYRVKMGFEGGQMPLTRRIPKRGFVNIFKKEYEIVNLFQLNRFEPDTIITPQLLKEKGIIKNGSLVKVLSRGELKHPLMVKAHAFSKRAAEKILGAKGRIERIA